MYEDRRLIEDFLPIQAISAEASREKSVRKGHISTLHLWWARRPLVACRAAVYGALVPVSKFVPENGPDNKKKSLGRANAAKFIERLCKYPGNPAVIKEARRHILEAHAERLTEETGKKVTVEDIEEGRAPRPKVLDMFAGGGAIPLEALRLGCEAYALDLNPVAHIIELCSLVYPQKYGKPDPNVRGMTGPKNAKGETTWGGLADEVRYWGEWVLKKVCVLNYTGGRGVVHAFGRQALPMVWDFAESNVFNPDGASWISGIEDVPAGLRDANLSNPAIVERGSATALPWSEDVFDAVITDPPYYDNVPYANISDYFYVWLRRSVGHLYPEHFVSDGTPKKKEAVADALRHDGDRAKANAAYEEMMAKSLSEAGRVLKSGGQLTVVYAHKTTLGWSTLVDALRRASFIVTEAWPLDTEKPGRLRAQESAALASSIFLVARKREGFSPGSYEDEVRHELDKIVRERVDSLWKMGITGADLVIAAVGAGLRAFTRFSRVEYANGEEVPAEKFLAEVQGVVLETLLEKIFGVGGSGVSAVDEPSRFYVLWRSVYKTSEMDAGEAIVFTYGQNVELDGRNGLSSGSRALVEKKKGKYRLRDFAERGADEKLGAPKDDGKAAPLIDILHRILWLMENEPRKLNDFLDDARPDRERLRLVAQALAGTALAGRKDEGPEHLPAPGLRQTGTPATTPAEGAALRKLVANWRALIEARLSDIDFKSGQRRLFN